MATPDPTTSIRGDRWVILTRPCANCGNDFTTIHATDAQRRYCSRPCGWAAKRNGATKPCESCGKVFYARASAAQQRFCCYECSTTHHGTGTRLYKAWTSMKDRCSNPKTRSYSDYGARGITVDARWRSDFVAFRDWALANGYADDLSIDRIDNDGPYSPENCRWVTARQQMNNRRNTPIVAAFGEAKPLTDWLRDPRCVVNGNTVTGRIRRGWSPERAMTLPATQHNHAASLPAGTVLSSCD